MTARYVTLGNGRRVTLGSYVAAWRACLTMARDTWLRTCPDGWPGSSGDALRQFRHGMHDRINRHVPGYGRGRKWHPDWQRAATQCAIAVNTPRLIVRWVPHDLRARLAHRLWDGE